MKHDHSQFQELPSPLPEGERLIWRGRPTLKGLALRAFHIREVGIYFGLILVWRLWSSIAHGVSWADASVAALWTIVPAVCAIAVLSLLAWLFRRATTYTVTSRRVLLQFGVALPMTMNIPLDKIESAALRLYRDGSGDIPLKLTDASRVSFLLLWPHIRPWQLRVMQPMLRSIPDASSVAAKLAEVLSGQPGPVAMSMPRSVRTSTEVDILSPPPETVAA